MSSERISYILLEGVVTRLQTQDGVDQAIATFTDAARSVAALPLDDEPKAAMLNGIERSREELVKLAEQLRTGDYIVVDPDLSGWRFVATYFPEGARRERSLGYDKVAGIVALAQGLSLPVVVGSEHPEQWREQTARRFRQAGVVAITEMSGRD